ncbi:MAG: GTP pyrophosphokinase family protein [Nocardiaceae bacterium]|nr:GTP pyrophosphokinase family protein [Nocardiaceae bacterium]
MTTEFVPDPETLKQIRRMRDEVSRFTMEYRFAVDEVLTKVSILREEFLHLHRYNPIEHVTSRIKKPESIVAKATRRGCSSSLASIREHITDIAGVRITCSFIDDTYRVLEAITRQDDVRVLSVKDYVANPKPNGYKSLHAIIEIPVFLSTGPVAVPVELQIRTIAMDFWASLEHKIYYKFQGEVPSHLVKELSAAAEIASELDRRMEQLHTEVHGSREPDDESNIPEPTGEELVRLLVALTQQSG